MAAWMTVTSEAFEDVTARYQDARNDDGISVPAKVWVDLERHSGRNISRAHLTLSIENARTLAEALTRMVMAHDAAERLAAEKAVA